MPRKSSEEKIADLEKQIEVAKARLREEKAKKKHADKVKERKERTHRLIQIGAICEEVYGKPITEGSMQNALRQFLQDQNTRGGYYSKALDKGIEQAAPEAADGAAENNQ